jgi:hypothetical protein
LHKKKNVPIACFTPVFVEFGGCLADAEMMANAGVLKMFFGG